MPADAGDGVSLSAQITDPAHPYPAQPRRWSHLHIMTPGGLPPLCFAVSETWSVRPRQRAMPFSDRLQPRPHRACSHPTSNHTRLTAGIGQVRPTATRPHAKMRLSTSCSEHHTDAITADRPTGMRRERAGTPLGALRWSFVTGWCHRLEWAAQSTSGASCGHVAVGRTWRWPRVSGLGLVPASAGLC